MYCLRASDFLNVNKTAIGVHLSNVDKQILPYLSFYHEPTIYIVLSSVSVRRIPSPFAPDNNGEI